MGFVSVCDQCGQEDDHPKHHYAAPGIPVADHHFDCIPHRVMVDVTHVTTTEFDPDERRFRMVAQDPIPEDDLNEHSKFILAVRKKAEGGLHGDKLREWIVKNGPQAEAGGE